MRIISASIDLTKIDKSKIVSLGKDGQPFKNGAKYLNVDILVNDEPNEYGQDTAIKINQSKEEREAKVPAIYLGNGKTVFNQGSPLQGQEQQQSGGLNQDEDDLPF